MKRISAIIILAIAVSCNPSTTAPAPADKKADAAMTASKDTAKSNLATLDFASKKDLSCGMPVSAGVSDTATYKGKLYGFCSAECKADFLKDPEAKLAAK